MSLLEPQAVGIPVPRPSVASTPYWEACKRGELRFQRCRSCATISAKATTVCAVCLGRDLAWELSAGRGRLYSWTVVWRAQQPSFRVPYAPAIVELDEGWRMLSAVIGCDPEALRAELPVQVEFHPADDAIVLPYFRPCDGA